MPNEYDDFEAPIPGQSLTNEPGNAAWEHPPQFTNPEDATEFLFDNILKKKNYIKFRAMLDAGVPIEGLVKTIVFAGFAEGKWTVDVAQLMVPAVTAVLVGLAQASGKNDAKMKMDRPKGDPAITMAKDIKASKTKEVEAEQGIDPDSFLSKLGVI